MMGIWLPYANNRENLRVLNDSHLADVVWQGLDTLRAIPRADDGRHVRMWADRPACLLLYVVWAEAELQARGVGEEPRVRQAFTWYSRQGIPLSPVPPWWYGHPLFHRSQCSHLIACDPEHYARRLPVTTPLDLKLIWPMKEPNNWEQK